ncbi:MAG: peroxidase-related enzyme [Phycisphaeraceae bacterium]|nr:MAG: peroxidase-related enzyme [Phycisphaeraceae bacterium]
MPRIKPLERGTATGQPRELLDAVHDKFGRVPNLLATMAHAPNVLQAYLQLAQAIGAGSLDPTLREQIAITVSTVNGCGYCVSAHAAMGRAAGVTSDAIDEAVRGEARDNRTNAALRFARAIVEKRGWVSDDDVAAVREAGFGDGEIAQIVGVVSMKTFTNYFNHVAKTELDFPEVEIPVPAHA